MYINVIGIIKNSSMQTVGYRLLDTDDNNKIKDVTKAQLVSVLQKKLLKVENIELVDNKTIRGKYYSIELLPKISINGVEHNKNKIIALCMIDNTTIKVASCDGKVANITPYRLKSMGYLVVNMTQDAIKCPKIETRRPKIETRHTKKIESEAQRLDAEAIDPEVVWSFEDFDKFMRLHNYSYTIKGKRDYWGKVTVDNYKKFKNLTLTKIDDNCKIVHLPKELYSVEGMYAYNRDIDYFIIPYGIYEIEQLHTDIIRRKEDYKEYRFSIKHFYTQDTVDNRCVNRYVKRFKGINYIDFKEPLILQSGEYMDTFNNCTMPKLLFNGTIDSLNNCFNECVFTETSCIDFVDIDMIDNSFCNIRIKKATFGKGVRLIAKSVNETALEEIHFREDNNIEKIRESFKNCNLTKVDFSNLHRIKVLGEESFSNCAIENIKLSNNIAYIEKGFLRNCPIKSIELPENISSIYYPIGGKDTVVKYTGKNKELTGDKLYGISENDKYDFGDVFTSLGEVALKTCKGSITLPKSITVLKKGSFSEAKMKIYDTLSTPKVDTIPSECFAKKVDINIVILNDNIKKISSNAFYKMAGINKIIISAKASGFEQEAFSLMDTECIRPIFYVVSSNEYAKSFLKSKNITFKEIDSIEDVTKTNNDIIDTYKLLYGADQKYSEFFEEPYINDIETLMNVSARIDRLDDISFGKNKLDTTKFRELNIETYPCVHKYAHYTYDKMDEYCKGLCSLTDRFIGTANLFTRLFDNNDLCYTKEFINKMANARDIEVKSLIEASPNGAIIVVASKTFKMQMNRLNILMITIGDKIVFQTAFDNYSDMLPYKSRYGYSHSIEFREDQGGLGVADLFENGDYIIADTKISGDYKELINITFHTARIPKSLMEGALKIFTRSLVTVGVESLHTLGKEYAIFYDCVQQKFLEILGKYIRSGSRDSITTLNNGMIKNIYDLSDFDKIDKIYFKGIRHYNYSEEVNNLIRFASLTKSEKDKIFKDASQYDTDGNEELCRVADYIYSNKILSKNELDVNILGALLSNNFFIDYTSSINWCKRIGSEIKISNIKGTLSKLFSCYITDMDGFVENGEEKNEFRDKLLGIIRNQNKIEDMQLIQDVKYEMLCIVNDETIETKKIQFKVCPIPLNDFIKALYTVGERRANNPNNDKASCKITDNEIDISNYVILCDRRLSNDIKYDRKLLLVLDKLNCDTYLIIMYDEEYYYTLFRFKDIISGYNLISDKWWVTSNQFEYLADSKFLSEHCPRNSELQEVRDAIMGGVPDCYPYIGKHVGLFKSLAKQPK